MKRKVLSVMLATAMTATLFAGCGSDASNADSANSADATASTTEAGDAKTDKSGTATANGSAYNSGVSGQGTSIYVSKTQRKKKPKTSMSFFTALSLSFNNLMTKKTRTILTAFAGSIGIIGIALILSISNGIQLYIDRVQRDTLSSYPIQLQSETVDISSMVSSMTDNGGSGGSKQT